MRVFVAAVLIAIAFTSEPVSAALVGSGFAVSGSGARFPDVAYNNTTDSYLVAWGDYAQSPAGVSGRLVSSDGTTVGQPFLISDPSAYALMPSVAYNATDNEYLVVWIDGRAPEDLIYGRRVSAAGAPVGSSFAISVAAQSLCAVAWSSVSNCYLVVYYSGGSTDVRGRRVRIVNSQVALGTELNISSDPDYSGYPDVSYGSLNDEFLVTWDCESSSEVRNIHGQRVKAYADALSGGVISVTQDGAKDRSCSAYDTVNSRWLVQFNDYRHGSYDQYGQLVSIAGAPVGGLVPIANTATMEGDTLRHSALSFAPAAQRYFSSFQTGGEMGGQELGVEGAALGGVVNLSSNPPGTEAQSCSNAVDFERNRFLVVWVSFDGSIYSIRGRLYELNPDPPPGPVANFVAHSGNQQNNLAWTNPVESDFTGTTIRFRTDAYPTSPTDGTLVVNKSGTPGANDGYLHTGVTNGVAYYYTAFAHDGTGPNYSVPKHSSGTPTAPTCFQDYFSYADGALNGNGGWTGSAGSSQIGIVSQTVKIAGGAGSYDAVHTANCGDPGTGYMWVHARARAGSGTSNVLWNLHIDDPSGANLARWYGTGTTAKGRIAGTTTVTPTQTLTGGWDDISVRIDPYANTSEFFFNGSSIGVLDHGQTGAGDVIGRVRIERGSLSCCPGDYMYLDSILIGEYDTTPPGPVTGFTPTPGDKQVSLSWINPTDADFAGTMVRYKTSGFPTGPTDGAECYNGTATSFVHTGLTNGTICYYSAYAYDAVPNYSTAAQASGTPIYFGPLQAKALPDSTQLTLTVGVVSAVFGDCFYVQCALNPIQGPACGVCGIKVVGAGSGLQIGQSAVVQGTILTDPATGERYVAAIRVR